MLKINKEDFYINKLEVRGSYKNNIHLKTQTLVKKGKEKGMEKGKERKDTKRRQPTTGTKGYSLDTNNFRKKQFILQDLKT